MNLYLSNVILALAWAAVTGSFSLANIVFGFVLGAMALYLIREQTGSLGYFRRSWRILSLTALFLYELVLSAWRVSILVLSPKMDLKPGIFAYPLKAEHDVEITLLANLITLTPGTLSVDVSEDRKTLFVHAIDCSNPEAVRRDIASGFERKIIEVFK
ncbi:Na+/H+ antiporter subunit E [Mesorhizobium sp. NBSH29]|uniref:Na+/H+ antiporter subunit E n=1 Tax=Mesorhizobium sp. NBSH29 TaxID=2654249 RepID=UPI0018967CB0|nr:Na+/H+ antiporter subunit E [Mesorhizobium sp. NBSH29]QPC87181.1 Na+/H+ antiporter subunit E [Mesorhizobium sp. NBSH29]